VATIPDAPGYDNGAARGSSGHAYRHNARRRRVKLSAM
jgi:hypothetical protein